MGVEQPESKGGKDKRKILISRPGKPVKCVFTDRTFEKAPDYRRPKPRTFEKAPVTIQNAPVIPQDKADLFWLAYSLGFRDGQRKERET